MKRFILFIIGAISCLMVSAQILSPIDEEKAEEGRRLDAEWVPTGVWPFINRRFQVAEVVTGFVTKKKTMVPFNIHIGKQTLWFAQRDTLMEANAGSIFAIGGGSLYHDAHGTAHLRRDQQVVLGSIA